MTTDVVEPESLTYYESKSNPDFELKLLPLLLLAKPSQIELYRELYCKTSDIAGQRHDKKRSLHI